MDRSQGTVFSIAAIGKKVGPLQLTTENHPQGYYFRHNSLMNNPSITQSA